MNPAAAAASTASGGLNSGNTPAARDNIRLLGVCGIGGLLTSPSFLLREIILAGLLSFSSAVRSSAAA